MMTGMFSSKAMSKSSGQESSYFLGWQEYEKNPFHPIQNPFGIIQMGLAENQLSFDLMESWIERNKEDIGFNTRSSAEASSSSSSSSSMLFRELALFQDYHGLPAFKRVLAEYMSLQRQKKVMIEPDKVVLTAGATSANETLIFCLCEPGEAFLVPTPYYPGFDRDLKWRTGVEIIPTQCSSTNSFKITSQALENSYQISQKLNLKVKGILITNPSNPLGTTLTLNELNHIITFAINKNIHIVSDEIYSSTVFKSPRFLSILEALTKRNLEHASIWNRVHVVSSLSKDLGLPGFRIGMIYSNSDVLISAATKMSSFSLVSSQSQYLLLKILRDLNFMEFYAKENKKRLRKRHKMIVGGLNKSGISCLESNAGLFCWVDMRHLLDDCDDFESEMDLWKKMIYEVRLNVSPGSSCHCFEPGWFRVCFSNIDEETLEISMKRIKAFVDSKKILGN